MYPGKMGKLSYHFNLYNIFKKIQVAAENQMEKAMARTGAFQVEADVFLYNSYVTLTGALWLHVTQNEVSPPAKTATPGYEGRQIILLFYL